MDGLYRLPPSQVNGVNKDPRGADHHSHYAYDPDYMAYDDPRRYSNVINS